MSPTSRNLLKLALWKLRPGMSCVLVCALYGGTLAPAAPANRLIPGKLAETPVSGAPTPGTPERDTPAVSKLHIVAIEGNHAVNVLKKHVTIRPVLEVRDASDRPVAGALVTFTSPAEGPSAVFANGLRTATVVSDPSGRVAPSGVTAVNPGSFEYQVSARYQEQEATATIAQTNVPNSSAAAASGSAQAQQAQSTPTTVDKPHRLSGWMIAALVGGAAAGAGIGIALGSGQSTKNTATTPTATIGTGSGATAGAPH